MQAAKGGGDVRLMDQHTAANHGVKRSLIRNGAAELSLHEKRVGAPVHLGALPRGNDGLSGTIHSDDEAVETNQVGCAESRIANATAAIEQPHTRRNPCSPSKRSRSDVR